tara:strand:- start:474 stop:665 length:192 start_codon:yes stop_codon:yes gene_type:complete
MTYTKYIILAFLLLFIGCGKVGPLTLPEEKVDKSILTYPCDDECEKKFEEEKKRQQSITLQTD